MHTPLNPLKQDLAEQFNFQASCTKMLYELGAVDTGGLYSLQIDTRAGALDLFVLENGVRAKFVSPHRAVALLGNHSKSRVDPVTGNWGFLPQKLDAEAVESIRRELAWIVL